MVSTDRFGSNVQCSSAIIGNFRQDDPKSRNLVMAVDSCASRTTAPIWIRCISYGKRRTSNGNDRDRISTGTVACGVINVW